MDNKFICSMCNIKDNVANINTKSCYLIEGKTGKLIKNSKKEKETGLLCDNCYKFLKG